MSSNKSYLEQLRKFINDTERTIKETEVKLASSEEISSEEGERIVKMLKEHLALQEAEEARLSKEELKKK
ncbi:MAG TPA: hypothetical protein ENH90_01400 [bacterium]|nr:hypothetical protein [bacterium]